MRLEIIPAKAGLHKFTAIFTRNDKSIKKIHFGNKKYEDFTSHHDKKRRELYILRHQKNEDFENPESAGSLSRYILWGDSTDLQKNIRAFKKRFGYI